MYNTTHRLWNVQHTTTHYSTLQHTATHCNTLQQATTCYILIRYTATYYCGCCNTLQHVCVACCSMLQCVAVRCSVEDMSRVVKSRIRCKTPLTYCNMLQHPATHTIRLNWMDDMAQVEQIATHCNMLQHTATCCNTLQYIAASNECYVAGGGEYPKATAT